MSDSRKDQLRILLLTDVFPPRSGGSGWSTFYLGKALAERGHRVRVLRPRYDLTAGRPSLRRTQYGGLEIEELAAPLAPAWMRRLNLDRAWQERRAAKHMAHRALQLVVRGEMNVLHGQHKVSAMAASAAVMRASSRGARAVSLATVRDYWPLCPASTRLFTTPDGASFECKECHHLRGYMKSVLAEGKRNPLELSLALARWVGTWQASRSLARCNATVAVSRYVRDELSLSGRVPGDKLYNIPNLVDLPGVDRALAGAWPLNDISPEGKFALFVGKWDTNKGAAMLPEVVKRSGIDMPVVLLGDGPLKGKIEADARARSLDFHFHSWLENDSVLRVMRSATVLLFPSAWQEPLSRVLLEGCAAGAALVALDTGGTADVIVNGQSGWLAPNFDSFVEGIRRVTEDESLNQALRSGARARAERVFAAPKVAGEVETLYRTLLERREKSAG